MRRCPISVGPKELHIGRGDIGIGSGRSPRNVMDMMAADRSPWAFGSTFFLCDLPNTQIHSVHTLSTNAMCNHHVAIADNAIGFQHCKIPMGLE